MTIQRAEYDVIRRPEQPSPPGPTARRFRVDWFVPMLSVALCLAHGFLIFVAMGGRSGLLGEWPILTMDHGIHYHHGLMTGTFLRMTGTTAGYDPYFMAGYPMSVVSGLSTTMPDLVMLASRWVGPGVAYKVHVLACAAMTPWLMAAAAMAWRQKPGVVLGSILLYLAYFWSDFPRVYAAMGMSTYLLSIPLGLLTVACLTNYLRKGGFGAWLATAATASAVFLVHVTSPLLVGPSGLVAYVVAVIRSRREGRPFPVSRHLGLAAVPIVILAVNAFWWLPGYWLASTKGPSDYAFSHPEPVLGRIGRMVWDEAPIQAVSLGLGLIGLAALARRDPVAASALGGFLAAGFGWGYLAGAFRGLDPLQPGRHTYACFSAACIAAGIGLGEILARLRAAKGGRLDLWAVVGFVLIGVRVFGMGTNYSIRGSVFGPTPFLSSAPAPRMLWLVDRLRLYTKPGERLLYEESGFAVPGLTDPYGDRHFSAILPETVGVEVIGGPYLHSTVTAKVTQFGEGRLFGVKDWGRDHFVRYARLYRPAAIACWSPKARAFCKANPDLVRVSEDDGTMLIGRVLGFEGATIRGKAEVEAGPGRLVVRGLSPGPDGLVVLRYHAVPGLVSDPPVPIEGVTLEEDPVPFIGLRSDSPGPITLRMAFPIRPGPGRRTDAAPDAGNHRESP